MSGNVWEWVDSWYDLNDMKYRVLRGGGWGSSDNSLRAADRDYDVRPDFANYFIGFRCALSLDSDS